ncbi:MAG: UDP-N-acetylmuramoyl-L-alanyl-D-glutamate--2,6-diaminopimelate ligase [Phycisphaerae bacterium]
MDDAPPTSTARPWTLGPLLEQAGLGSACPEAFLGHPVSGITDDSREVVPGSCFVAIGGGTYDGHDFVNAAVRSGAETIISERSVADVNGAATLRVPDARLALARLGAAFYGLRRGQCARALEIIGITGTNGKGTTAELLRAILRASGQPTALLGTMGYDLIAETVAADWTTPPPVALCRYLAQAREAGARWAVLEASSHALDQRRCDGLAFRAGVFTNLSGDHLDYHGDRNGYAAAKQRLFNGLAPAALAVVNGDDAEAGKMVSHCPADAIRFGLDGADLDFTANLESLRPDGSRFTLVGPGLDIQVELQLVGRHNVMNALAAAACASGLGFNGDAIRRGLESVAVVRGRLEPVCEPGQDFALLVDYAHTDDALRQVLSAVRPLTSGRLICVFGCGGDRDRSKRPRMAEAVAEHSDLAWLTSDNPRTEDPQQIIKEVLEGFGARGRCRVAVEPDRRTAIQQAVLGARANDTVLIAGKGHEDYQIIGRTRRYFDDVQEARTVLRQRLGLGEGRG